MSQHQAAPGATASGTAVATPATTAITGQTPVVPGQAVVQPAGTPATENVPALLNRLQTIAVTVCVVFGLAFAALQFASWQASGRAADNAEQLIRVQEIQSSLLRVDALATNAFLVGGLEPADRRAEYDATVNAIFTLVTDAADAQPADREALAALNAEVGRYVTGIAQARDNNRQALPVGAAYLRTAGDELRADALPIVAALVTANSERASDEMDGQNTLPLLLLAVVALALLWWVNRMIAMRFRRRINVGIAVAAGLVVVVTLIGVIHSVNKSSGFREVEDGAFANAVEQAEARTAANDAKANESLRLIARGSGATYEEKWTAAAAVVDEQRGVIGAAPWAAYKEKHAEVVRLDESGDWDGAVRLATTADDTGSTANLNKFDTDSKAAIGSYGNQVSDGFRSGRGLAISLAGLSLLAGFAASWFATRGVNERRKEYS